MGSRARYTDALSFSCPTCYARIGEYCASGCEDGRADKVHARRAALVPARSRPNDVKSVYAVATAVESNRRRH
jgi:hypothetical protein